MATQRLVPSPLKAFRRFHDSKLALRTAYSPRFNTAISPPRVNEAAHKFRQRCRSGDHDAPTSGHAPGFVQANVVMLSKDHAFDFLQFCLRNPKFCPLLAVTEPGQTDLGVLATDSDIRKDIPRYRVYRDGKTAGPDITCIDDIWSDDLVTFLLGCSFSWEDVLDKAGLRPRQIEEGCNVPMYRTNIRSHDVGPFGSELVVSMRPYRTDQLQEVFDITAQYPGAHGSPLHWGDPEEIGIAAAELETPPWGDKVTIRDDEVPVFWACGSAVIDAKLPLVVTHSPGFMFVTDIYNHELREDV